ncbi:MAG: hypothetical protein JWR32_165 [Mycobacterium sp.]|nr:hypothetical protein [Mycobacterium sp.]
MAQLPYRHGQDTLGLVAGVLVLRPVGAAAAVGLVLFFLGALYTHLHAHDYGTQFPLAMDFSPSMRQH